MSGAVVQWLGPLSFGGTIEIRLLNGIGPPRTGIKDSLFLLIDRDLINSPTSCCNPNCRSMVHLAPPLRLVYCVTSPTCTNKTLWRHMCVDRHFCSGEVYPGIKGFVRLIDSPTISPSTFLLFLSSIFSVFLSF